MPAPKLPKSPPELIARFDQLAAAVPDATRRPMFGYPSLTLNGHMFFSLFGDHAVLRLDEPARQEIAAKHGASAFEPMPGRPMTGYMSIPAALTASPEMSRWVQRSRDHAATLPPKKPKPKPKK
jgi:TfoX/Sxy family transcriptional regulator of competence genes